MNTTTETTASDLPCAPARGEPGLVSVVIPAYNAAATLGETLASLRAQHHAHWEAWVVDDGSTDATAAVVRAAAAEDPRIRLLRGAHRGVSAARNLGIAAARGEFVAFLDADDLWEPGKLAAQLAQLRADPGIGLSFTRARFVAPDGRPTGSCSAPHAGRIGAAELLYGNPATTASTLLVRREALDAVGGFDEALRWSEDLEWMLRVALHGRWAVAGLAEPLVRYRTSPAGASADLAAMQRGWDALAAKAEASAPALLARHRRPARASHLRQLARRALRLRLPAGQGLALWRAAWHESPPALLRDPWRSTATLAALLGLGAWQRLAGPR